MCGFSLEENYFAWQAFGRRYPECERGPVPPYLRRTHFDTISVRTNRVEVLNCAFTEYLESRPDNSLDRFVLLDAQDWMTASQMTDLWTQIDRTAVDQDARVIFRTAGIEPPLARKLPQALLSGWEYLDEESRTLHARDRSSIYGGFHVYARRLTN